jgi:hypothetical protein
VIPGVEVLQHSTGEPVTLRQHRYATSAESPSTAGELVNVIRRLEPRGLAEFRPSRSILGISAGAVKRAPDVPIRAPARSSGARCSVARHGAFTSPALLMS